MERQRALGLNAWLGPLRGVIRRLGSSRFIAWAMLASTAFIVVQFALTRSPAALRLPPSVHAITLAMAVFCTVLPTWMIAES